MVISLHGAVPAGATAYRILHHSASIIGADNPVSGTVVVVPGGAPLWWVPHRELGAWDDGGGRVDLAMRDASVITDACSAEVGADCNSVPTCRLFRPGWSRDASPRAVIGGNQPGSAPTSAPLLVVQGTGDPLIPYLATTDFVDRQPCRADGDTVEHVPVPGQATAAGSLLPHR